MTDLCRLKRAITPAILEILDLEIKIADIRQKTVELVLASVEISTLLIRVPPTLETLAVLQEAEAFPGHEPEVYYPEVPMLTAIPPEDPEAPPEEDKLVVQQPRQLRSASMPVQAPPPQQVNNSKWKVPNSIRSRK